MIAINLIKNFCYSLENQLTFITKDLEEKDYSFKPDDKTPAIGWVLGHVLISHDFIVNYSILGNKPLLTKELLTNYGTGSSGEIKGEESPVNFVDLFRKVNKTVVETLLTKEDSWLEEFPVKTKNWPDNWLNKNNTKAFVLYFNHSLNHTGQMMELKRKIGKKVWGI